MRIVQNVLIPGIKEVGSFVGATALGCGPIQLLGAFKILEDSLLLTKHVIISFKLRYDKSKIGPKKLPKNPKIQALVNAKLKMGDAYGKASADEGQLSAYFEAKIDQKNRKLKRIARNLLADLGAMVPVLGGHLYWRIGTGDNTLSCRPFVTRIVQQALGNYEALISKSLFWRSRRTGKKGDSEIQYPSMDSSTDGYKKSALMIPVRTATKTRSIEAIHFYREGNEKNPTIIISHGAAQTARYYGDTAGYYLEKGYNVLLFTIGGYPNSPGCRSSEAHVYQDVDAVKAYLKGLGVAQVAFHGESLGGAAAFYGAASDVVELETLFVVADQTFNSAKDVAGNCLQNVFSPLKSIGRGAFAAAIPQGLQFQSQGKIGVTDGFNSLAKAKVLAEKKVSVYALESQKDILMGRKKNKRTKIYEKNFAQDLVNAAGCDVGENVKTLCYGHCKEYLKSEDLKHIPNCVT